MRPAALLLVLAVSALAEAPNLTGKWKFIPAQSNIDNAPDEMHAVIQDAGGKIHMVQKETRAGQPRTIEFTFNKDGDSVNNIGDVVMKTTFKTAGDRLLENTVFSTSQGDITRKSVIAITDGKVLTMEGVIQTPAGENKFKLVLEREE